MSSLRDCAQGELAGLAKYSTLKKDLADFKPVKVFDAKKFAGKIDWKEDPLEYQKRLRNEWN
ncbi:hypothetical protein AGMMS49525_18380 [Bacteroidia bacterium]|nr:hypothetical protein AGMMS49525_18380 [Bacteroidia bacterium]